MEHVGPEHDWNLGYRSKDEIEFWKNNDPVECLGNMLPERERTYIEETVNQEVAIAMDFASQSPFPDAGELYKDVYD